MNSLTSLKRRTAQTVALVSALALAGIAQAQYGNDSGGSSSSSSTNSNSSGQSSQKQKSYDQSNAADKGQERDKLERRVEKAKKRDQEHNLDPASIRP